MQNFVAKLLFGVILTSITLFAGDNSLGVWTRNIKDTKYTAANPNPIVEMTMIRDAAPNGIKITSIGKRLDGTKINYSVTVVYDGKDYPVSGFGSVFDTIAITRIDDNTFPSVTKKGKYHMNGITKISPDGKTMTITNKGTGADGKEADFEVVWDKKK